MKRYFYLLVLAVVVAQGFLTSKAWATPLEDRVAVLEVTVAQLQNALALLQANPAVKMGTDGYLKFDPNELNGVTGPHAIFERVNLHVRNGTGVTRFNNGNGLGNLIIGYNEEPGLNYGLLQPGERSGYHNLIIGVENRFLANANSGIVQGEGNTIGNANASAIGGDGNKALADSSAVFGGGHNIANGPEAVTVGGWENVADGFWSTLVGGTNNNTPNSANRYTVVLGGQNNTATGLSSSVVGGQNNAASGNWSSVSGGIDRQANGDHDWAAGSLWEDY